MTGFWALDLGHYHPRYMKEARYHRCCICSKCILCDKRNIFLHARKVHGLGEAEYAKKAQDHEEMRSRRKRPSAELKRVSENVGEVPVSASSVYDKDLDMSFASDHSYARLSHGDVKKNQNMTCAREQKKTDDYNCVVTCT